jgi:hypothetical protein
MTHMLASWSAPPRSREHRADRLVSASCLPSPPATARSSREGAQIRLGDKPGARHHGLSQAPLRICRF